MGRQRRQGNQLVTPARGQRRTAVDAERNVRSDAGGHLRQFLTRYLQLPQVIQAAQRGRGICRATTKTGGHGDLLGEVDVGVRTDAGVICQGYCGPPDQVALAVKVRVVTLYRERSGGFDGQGVGQVD